jgi:hypothetical protein
VPFHLNPTPVRGAGNPRNSIDKGAQKKKATAWAAAFSPIMRTYPGGGRLHVIRMYGIIPQISVNAREFRAWDGLNIDNDINN